MKTAFIVGSSGQDGTLLRKHLIGLGYATLEIDKDHIEAHGISWPNPVSITSYESVLSAVDALKPDEIYYLAAIHSSSERKDKEDLLNIKRMYEVNSFGFLNFLEAARLHSPGTRLFFAASSHIFAPSRPDQIQDENTPIRPHNVYGMTKAAGLWLGRLYREHHGLHVSTGILYNHESPLRSEDFLSKKICRTAVKILRGEKAELRLENLDSVVDWSDAEDFVQAFHLILQQSEGDEYIVASSKAKSVSDFVELAFTKAGLKWQDLVKTAAGGTASEGRIGDARKLKLRTGWEPKFSFEAMIEKMLRAEGLDP